MKRTLNLPSVFSFLSVPFILIKSDAGEKVQQLRALADLGEDLS